MRNGPRDADAVLGSRYWLTDKGIAATDAIRAGEDLDTLANTFGRSTSTLRAHLSAAGFSATNGQPIAWVPDLDPDETGPHRPFKFPPWMADAVCASTDPESFFPDKGGSTREAKNVCASCNVAAECLDYALDNNERFGIWGGTTERERRRLQAALAAPQEEPLQEEATA